MKEMKWTAEKIATFLAPFVAWLKANKKKQEKWDMGLKWAYEDVEKYVRQMPTCQTDDDVKQIQRKLRTAGQTTGIDSTGYPIVKANAKWVPPAHAKAAWDLIEKGLKRELKPQKRGFEALLTHRNTHTKKDKDGKIIKQGERFFQSRDDIRDTRLATFMGRLKADLISGDWDGTIEGLKKVADLPEGVNLDD